MYRSKSCSDLCSYSYRLHVKALTSDLYDFQSPEDKRVATSLQTEEVMVSARWKMSTNGRIVIMKGGILSLTTMFLSLKPASPTGTSTLACPPRGGTQRHICWKSGEVNPRRDTPTTPTLDEELIQRGIHQHVTAL